MKTEEWLALISVVTCSLLLLCLWTKIFLVGYRLIGGP